MSIAVLKEYLEIFGSNAYLQAAIVVVISLVAAKIVDFFVSNVFRRAASKTRTELDDNILQLLHRPVFTTVAFIGLYIAFALVTPSDYEWIGEAILKTLLVLIWLVFLLRFSKLILDWMSATEERFHVIQPATVPLFNIGARVLFIGLACYGVLLSWEIDVTGWLASAGILGLAIGLAAKDTLSNLFAGVSILTDAPYRIGDYIILDNAERGEVTKIGLRSTRILTRDQIEVTVPNSVIAQGKIINESGGPSTKQRVKVPVGVAYGSDVDRVVEILMQVASEQEHLASFPEPVVRFVSFGASSLDFELRCWIDEPVRRGLVISELNTAIYKALGTSGIEIPFPKRDLYIKELPGDLAVSRKE